MITIPDELVIAMGQPVLERQLGDPAIRKEVIEVILNHPVAGERLLQKIADGQKSSYLTTAEAAHELRTTSQTLLEKHVEMKLNVSTIHGVVRMKDGRTRLIAPLFHRAQIEARVRENEVKGRAADDREAKSAKVTEFPQRQKQQKAS